MSLPGYHSQLIHIDANQGEFELASISPSVLRQYIGGTGLGTWLLLSFDRADIDALHPDAPLIIAFSPLIGTPLTTSARFALVSKSPLSQRLNDSLCGSRFAISGKGCGVDAIALTGRCEEPSVLIIEGHDSEDGAVTAARFEPAADLWGMETDAAEQRLHELYGPGFAALTIGPAGENLVRFATVSHDGRHAGRGGTGAVLGSKRIKAVLVRGNIRPKCHDTTSLVRRARDWSQRSTGPATAKYRELGTVSNLLVLNQLHALPSRNFQQGSFDHADKIAFDESPRVATDSRRGCAACNIGCEHYFQMKPSDQAFAPKAKLEYESLFALGPLCGVGDQRAVLAASKRCDQLGIDTISVGGTIAFAMECRERGFCGPEVPNFGQGDEILELLEAIAYRRGVGDILAEGSRLAAERIGHSSIDFAPQIKGLELPGYEPRTMPTLAMGMAVGSRGADHNRSSAYEVDLANGPRHKALTQETIAAAIDTEDRAAVLDSLILCKFLRGIFDDYFRETVAALNDITGWDMTSQELRMIGKRIVTTKKIFNMAAGWNKSEDTLPKRFLEQAPLDAPNAKLSNETLQEGVASYYALREWDSQGCPTPEHLRNIGWRPPT